MQKQILQIQILQPIELVEAIIDLLNTPNLQPSFLFNKPNYSNKNQEETIDEIAEAVIEMAKLKQVLFQCVIDFADKDERDAMNWLEKEINKFKLIIPDNGHVVCKAMYFTINGKEVRPCCWCSILGFGTDIITSQLDWLRNALELSKQKMEREKVIVTESQDVTLML